MKNELDVLLVARPDQSLQIYHSLLKQNTLKYHYLTFKVFPVWLKKIVRIKKMVAISKYVTCSWKLTLIMLCKYKFHFHFAKAWNETNSFDRNVRSIFNSYEVKLIHYWPEHISAEVVKSQKQIKDCFSIADIHMPHPVSVFDEMKPIYNKYGINPYKTQLYYMSCEQKDLIGEEINILVPSSYVAETYRKVYDNKKYYVIPYGIILSNYYERRNKSVIKEFVYAGRISLEKGGDLLLTYFSSHPELNLHLFGTVIIGQENVFKKYYGLPNIFFHGSIPKVELQKNLRLYDVGIHLSRFDAYSLAVGEMIGVGLPVIVSDHTGNKDDVLAEGLGLVTRLSDEEIDNSIKRMTQPHVYNEFVNSIDDYIRNRYISYGQKVVGFYNSILNK